jgi:hypothetical protein
LMTGRLPVAPTRESQGRLQRNVSPTIARSGGLNNQRFFSQSKPSFTPRPFNEQAAQTQRMIANSRTQAGTMSNRGNNGLNGSRLPSAPAMQQRNGDPQSTRPFPSNNSRSMAPSATQNGRFNGSSQQSGVRPGWRSFTPPSGSNSGTRGNNGYRQPQAPARMNQTGPSRPSTRFEQQSPTSQQRQGGWRTFTPSQPQSRPAPRVNTPPARPGYQNLSSRSSQPQGGWSSPTRSSNSGSYRQSLDMRQPVVSRRAPSNYYGGAPQRGYSGGGSPYGRPNSGYSPRPSSGGGGSYGRPSGGYSPQAPRGGGSYSRPSGGGGRSYNPPSGGGNRGGGGGRPSGGGGSRPAAPRGGGGRPHR